jgi:hypothetical protein
MLTARLLKGANSPRFPARHQPRDAARWAGCHHAHRLLRLIADNPACSRLARRPIAPASRSSPDRRLIPQPLSAHQPCRVTAILRPADRTSPNQASGKPLRVHSPPPPSPARGRAHDGPAICQLSAIAPHTAFPRPTPIARAARHAPARSSKGAILLRDRPSASLSRISTPRTGRTKGRPRGRPFTRPARSCREAILPRIRRESAGLRLIRWPCSGPFAIFASKAYRSSTSRAPDRSPALRASTLP